MGLIRRISEGILGRSIQEPLTFPPPYQGMLAVSSDVEFTSWQAQLDLIEVLGYRGLECGFSYWCFGDPATTWRFFEADDQPSPYANAAASLARAGILDTLHSFGGVTDGAGCRFDRDRIRRALDYLADSGVRTRVYANHGSPQDTQNVGGAWATYQEGDVFGSSKYHLDLTSAFGVRFFWTDIDYDNDQPFFGLSEARGKNLLIPQRGRDGTPIMRFRRFRGALTRAPYPGNLSEQLDLVLTGNLTGYSIVYQHLGVARNPDGKPVPNSPPYFNIDALTALDRLAALQADGVLLVTTTERLLMHALLMQARPWTLEKSENIVRVIFRKHLDYAGLHFVLSMRDLEGWAIPVIGDERVFACFDDSTWEMLRIEILGKEYAMIPWKKLPLLDELEKSRSLV
jgi:hypothetical protein